MNEGVMHSLSAPLLHPNGKSMNTETVNFYNSTKGFGFIQPIDGSADIFVHVTALERAGIDSLCEGQKLQFDLEHDQRGRHAAGNLRLL
jgi:cold shock protein